MKFIKITLLLLILFVSIGIVSASDNNTDLDVNQLDEGNISDIQKIIDNTQDNGTVKLEGKKYVVNTDDYYIYSDKSLVIEGEFNKTIIEKNSSGYLHFKNHNNLVFKNIIFKSTTLILHGCKYTVHEMNISFVNCGFYDLKDFRCMEMESDSVLNLNINFDNCSFMDNNVGYLGRFSGYNSTQIKVLNSRVINNTIGTSYLLSYVFFEDYFYLPNLKSAAIDNSIFENNALSFYIEPIIIINSLILDRESTGNSNVIENSNNDCVFSIRNSIFNNPLSNWPYPTSFKHDAEIDNCAFYNYQFTFNSPVKIYNSAFTNSSFEFSNVTEIFIENTSIQNDNSSDIPINILLRTDIIPDYEILDSYFINSTGKYQINLTNINIKNTWAYLEFNQSEIYHAGDKLIFKLTDINGKPINNTEISIYDSVNICSYIKEEFNLITTDENGIATYTLKYPGNHQIKAESWFSYDFNGLIFNLPVLDSENKFNITFNSKIFDNQDFEIKIIDYYTGELLSNAGVQLIINQRWWSLNALNGTVNASTVQNWYAFGCYDISFYIPDFYYLSNVYKIEFLQIINGTASELQYLIDNTPEGGILVLPYDFTCDSDIIISKDIVIDGNGHSIGTTKSYSLEIDSDNVALKNIDFKYSNSDYGDDDYIIVDWNGVNGTISNCRFIGSYRVHFLNLSDLLFYNNHDLEIISEYMDNCSFVDNSDLYVLILGETFGAVNSYFYNNHAFEFSLCGDFSYMDNCSFENNFAGERLIDIDGCCNSIKSCNFINNYCDYYLFSEIEDIGTSIVNSNFTRNYCGKSIINMSPCYIAFCSFENNIAEFSIIFFDGSDAVIRNSKFINNRIKHGPLINSEFKDISNCKFINNREYKVLTTVKAPKATFKVKKSRYFKVTIKNKLTNKAINGIKIKIKVYTAKKYKTFMVKTYKKGLAKINTKSLKVGYHKVVISSGNGKYNISYKSSIVIKK